MSISRTAAGERPSHLKVMCLSTKSYRKSPMVRQVGAPRNGWMKDSSVGE